MDGKKWFKRAVVILILALVVFQVGRQVFMENEWAARNYIHDQAKSVFSHANDRVQARYGIKPYGDPKISEGDIPLSAVLPKPVVLLIHGLDEPGRVWLNLAPVLDDKGYTVMFMSYPNDQKIRASAGLFFRP